MKNKIKNLVPILLIIFGINSTIKAQNVNIPDPNFKTYLLSNTSINTDNDTVISVAEATNYTGVISCSNKNILDLTGIEAFINITELIFYNNPNLNEVDVTSNTALTNLDCSSTNISVLDLSNNVALIDLDCSYTLIDTLDVSNNVNLESLYCRYSKMIKLDLSNQVNLDELYCNDCFLTSLNIANGNNTNLTLYSFNNVNLTCITVDDVSYSTTNWTVSNNSIPLGASFSTNCNVLVSSINVTAAVSTINTSAGTLQMSATVLPANADDATYTWSVTDGTGSASISTAGLLTANTNGTVTVKATANDGSFVEGTKIITISNQTVGINEATTKAVNIYPNPVKNQLFVNLGAEQIIKMNILDVTGKTVKTINGNVTTVNVSELNKGIYFLNLQTEQGILNSKFIKK